MKPAFLPLLFIGFANSLFGQTAPCRSAYDNAHNDVHTATHYFPGPMTVPLNTDINGTIDSGTDIDYYKFYITSGGTIRLTLSGLPANYNLKLVNSQGTTLATSSNSGLSSETINYTASSNTYYLALVYPANKRTFNVSSCYTLRVTTLTATRSTDSNNAELKVEDTPINLYPNPTTGPLTVELADLKNEVRIALTDMQGKTISERFTQQQQNTFDVSGLPAGCYYIDVFREGQRTSRHKLIKQ